MSYLSELDPAGFQRRDTEDLLNQSAPDEDGPGFFRGIIKGPVTGLLRGLTNLNDAMLTATDLVVPMSDKERGQQEHIRRTLTDFFTPDARTVGTAGRVIGGAAEGLAPLLVPEVGIPLMVGTNTLTAGKRAVDEGVDAKSAGELAAIEGAASYAGLKLPILGKTLGQRLATGAAGNLALGAGATEAEHALLNSRGYEELAKNYDPLDGEARAVDLLSGLVFGGLHHLTLPSEKAAVATLNNAKHFQQDTAPGVPADPVARAAHARAMDTATDQLVRGDPVNVPEDVTQAKFEPRPNAGNPIPDDLKELDASQQPPLMLTVEDAVTVDGPAPQDFRIIRDGAGNVAAVRVSDGHLIDLTTSIKAGMSIEEALAVQTSHSQSAEHVKPAGDSVKSTDETKPDEGYSVAEGVLTDEQLAQFQGLRSDVPADQNLGGSGEGVPGRAGLQDAGGARREPLRVFRGAGRELVPEDFLPESLGHASGKPAAGLGVFFSKSSEQAAQHGPVAEHFLDIRNPKVFKAEDLPGFDSKDAANAFSRQLEAEGHDGIVIDASGVGGPVNYVAFSHEQVLKPESVAKPKAPPPAKPKAAEPVAPAEKAGEADDPATAALREHLAGEDIQVPTGERDAEGGAITRSAREQLAKADAETAAAQETGKGIAAAVSCFLTRGA